MLIAVSTRLAAENLHLVNLKIIQALALFCPVAEMNLPHEVANHPNLYRGEKQTSLEG
jgi:hypothetical protein